MAAPTPSAKPTSPTGFKMPDGYRTLVVSKNHPLLQIWIQSIKPGGVDGGEKINTTTMYNNAWRTFAARSLRTKEDTVMKGAFDPDILRSGDANNINAAINDPNDTITEFYPDGSSQCFYGYYQKMGAPEFKEGEFPVAEFTIVATNWDGQNQVEAGPFFTAATGT